MIDTDPISTSSADESSMKSVRALLRLLVKSIAASLVEQQFTQEKEGPDDKSIPTSKAKTRHIK